jgi:hypothetical protein
MKSPRHACRWLAAVLLAAGVLPTRGSLRDCEGRRHGADASFGRIEGASPTKPAPAVKNAQSPTEGSSTRDDPALSATLDVVRQEIQEWRDSLGPRPGNKNLAAEAENRLTGELRELLNDGNTPSIVQALTPEDLESPFGLAALTRWADKDPGAAARWVAARPGATDDQAWIVAQRLVEDPVEFERFSAELPESPWKQEFLGHFGAAVVSLDPVLAVYIAQRMAPGDAQNALLQQATE